MMQAVIMAAGKSTRTYPLTATKPKPLLRIANKTILKHTFEQLEKLVDEIILVIGYEADKIKEYVKKEFSSLNVKYVVQDKQLGTGHALLSCMDILKDKFVVMNGDDLFSREDIKKCIKHEYCVLVKEVEDLSRFGEVVVENHTVKRIREKPGGTSGLANTGLYVLNKEIFNYKLKKSERGEFEIPDYISHVASDNKKVDFEYVSDYWIPITYPWNLLEANEFMLKKIKRQVKGSIEKNTTIKGEVIIGRNTIIKSGVYIEGPVIIGEDCVIGPNCYIRAHSTIGNGSKIGNAVEIKNSVVGKNTSIGHLSYVGDSVMGDNVNFGAGTIIANLRHDNKSIKTPVKGRMIDTKRRKLGVIIGDNVHTGINTSIYPGRKIFPNKTTLPGEIVKRDISQ